MSLTILITGATAGFGDGLRRHVNINRTEMMPTCQAPGPLAVKRREG